MLTEERLKTKLQELLALPAETEVVEFKEATSSHDFTKIGKYFSALSNEANLKGLDSAWLIFGVRDKDKAVVGSQFRPNRADLDNLKSEIANKTTNRITFREIYELVLPEGRIIMFEIPASPRGLPIAWEGHYYGRDGEQLHPLNLEEIERMRAPKIEDWSAAICPEATIDDLDPQAILLARKNFIGKFPQYAEDTKNWDDITFLNKAKLTKQGKITRTAILLLGKSESEYFINPSEGKIRWILKDAKGNDKDYHLETIPLILAVDKIYEKIRKLTYRYIKEGTLFPDELPQYDPFTIREAINNCIAHQDYSQGGGRINVVEFESDQLVFSNVGSFIPKSVEKVVLTDAPEEKYRNTFLVNGMFNIRMVDSMGGGIRKMFNFQRERFFPMPDYDFEDGKVKVTIIGKILDIDYARKLAQHADLDLAEILMLDKVQKQKNLSDFEEKRLKKRGLIEGRKPNFYISKDVAQKTGQKADYTKNKAFENTYYMDLIVKFIGQHKQMERKEADELLWDKLPQWMSEEQKKNKIANTLTTLRLKKIIENTGTASRPIWVFTLREV